MSLSPAQREVFAAVFKATRSGPGAWYRAGQGGLARHPRGETVSLVSLHRCGLLKRRAWRGAEGERDAAYEYRLSDDAERVLDERSAARQP